MHGRVITLQTHVRPGDTCVVSCVSPLNPELLPRERRALPYLLGGRQRPACRNCDSGEPWARFCSWDYSQFSQCAPRILPKGSTCPHHLCLHMPRACSEHANLRQRCRDTVLDNLAAASRQCARGHPVPVAS